MKVAFLLPLPLRLKPEHPGSNLSSIIVLWPWASPSSLQSSSFLNYKLAPIPIWASPNSSKGWRRWHVRKGFWSTPKLLPCTKYHKMQSLPLCSIQSRPAPSDMVATGCVANEHLWKLTPAVSIKYVAGSVDLDGPQDMCTYKVLNSSAHLLLFQNNKIFAKYRQAIYTATKRRCFDDGLNKVFLKKKKTTSRVESLLRIHVILCSVWNTAVKYFHFIARGLKINEAQRR